MKKLFLCLLMFLLAACAPRSSAPMPVGASPAPIKTTPLVAATVPETDVAPNDTPPAISGRILILDLPHLYLTGARGGDRLAQFTAPSSFDMLALSPDGKRLAYFQGNDVYIEDVQTQRAVVVSHEVVGGADGTEMRWSADGEKLAFTCSIAKRPGPSICLMDVKSGDIEILLHVLDLGEGCPLETFDFEFFDWSRDGSKMVFICSQQMEKGQPKQDFGIYLYDVATRAIQKVLSGGKQTLIQYIKGAFISPDNRAILLSGTAGNLNFQVFRIGIDGSNLARITHDENFSFELPVWNPDGSSFYVYRTQYGEQSDPSRNAIQLFDLDGKVLFTLNEPGAVIEWIK
ncbi:MAG: hypothetical protein WA821_02500 [Anaerolineales bacterium]